MEINSVVQSLSPVMPKPEARTASRLANSYSNEINQLMAATLTPHPSATIGTKVDVRA